MRGALTLHQSETEKSKPTNLKSTSIFSCQCCFRLLTWLILHFPSLATMWAHALDVILPPQPLSKAIEKNDEVRGSCRLMFSTKGFMHN